MEFSAHDVFLPRGLAVGIVMRGHAKPAPRPVSGWHHVSLAGAIQPRAAGLRVYYTRLGCPKEHRATSGLSVWRLGWMGDEALRLA